MMAAPPSTLPARKPIPIVFGVVGHRDLRPDDHERLAEAVRPVLADARRRTPLCRHILLSSLADGADRLVARVARECGFEVMVPLPMPRAQYVQTFSGPESVREFDDLVRDVEPFEVSGGPATPEYQAAGEFIARHSFVLIALWDGRRTGKPAGTAWAVHHRRHRGCPRPGHAPARALDAEAAASLLEPPDDGPIVHVKTPRMGDGFVPANAFETEWIYPEGWGKRPEATYARMLEQTEAYNHDAFAADPGLDAERERTAEDLLPAGAGRDTAGGLEVLGHYATADALAIRYKQSRASVLAAILAIVVAGVLGLQAYSEELLPSFLVWVYPGTVGVAFLIFFRAERRQVHRKHLDYRALAEGLRLMVFWRLAGVEDPVTEHYLHQYRTELDWIRNALRSCTVLVQARDRSARAAAPPASGDGAGLAETHWVNHQAGWFATRAERGGASVQGLEMGQWVLFGLAFAMALTLAGLDGRVRPAPEPDLQSALVIALGGCLAAAAAIGYYVDRMLLAEQVRQYERMAALFRRGAELIAECDDVAGRRSLLRELGIRALAENAAWVQMHRARPIEVPRG